ncbi:Eukaryotic translation initiation factor 3 subunit G-1 [Nesidiocoris tenuis]|uniref:Eukaryotic translation initiation factor 3 subunit G-1 n=1 Tax=Nesidiocoris tenuis TaxID=355587 RepID=A0ABN7AE45_9HEMI|nr:Eukaryotic translation initiation factor 3 subunit G-1 [Nesidiocoris tenuis]
MDSWDSEPTGGTRLKVPIESKSKWEGEDADEDVVDSWDQDDEEQEEEEDAGTKSPTPKESGPGKKNLKKLGEKFEEKERKKKQQMAGKTLEGPPVEMTPEEKLAEKLRVQQLQEESDLSLAKEVFGVLGKSALESKEDFDSLKDEVLKLTADAVKNTNFANFTEEMVHSLTVHLTSSDIKKLHTWLGNLHIEKSKLEKGDKTKKSKGKGKAKLKLEGDNDYLEYSDYSKDFDDFI